MGLCHYNSCAFCFRLGAVCMFATFQFIPGHLLTTSMSFSLVAVFVPSCSGTTDDDEGVANMAADFGVAWELNETGIRPWKRYWPIEDIVKIYQVSGNNNVNAGNVSGCKILFDLALWAEMTFGPLLFTVYVLFPLLLCGLTRRFCIPCETSSYM